MKEILMPKWTEIVRLGNRRNQPIILKNRKRSLKLNKNMKKDIFRLLLKDKRKKRTNNCYTLDTGKKIMLLGKSTQL